MLKNSYITSLKEYTQELKNIVDIIVNIEQEFNAISKEKWYTISKREKEEKIIKIIIKKVNRIKDLYKKEYASKNYYNGIVKDLENAKIFEKIIKDYLKILIKEDTGTEETKVKAYQLYLNSEELKKSIKEEFNKGRNYKKRKRIIGKDKKRYTRIYKENRKVYKYI